MPIYDYACGACDNQVEVVALTIQGAPESVWCGNCGGRMTRVMSAPAVVYDFREIKCDFNKGKRAPIDG